MGKQLDSALIQTCSSVEEVNHNCLTPHSGEMDLNATITFEPLMEAKRNKAEDVQSEQKIEDLVLD